MGSYVLRFSSEVDVVMRCVCVRVYESVYFFNFAYAHIDMSMQFFNPVMTTLP